MIKEIMEELPMKKILIGAGIWNIVIAIIAMITL